jgi:hypothetical protein
VGQPVTDRDRPRVGGGVLHVEPGQIRGDRLVEAQPAGVAEDQNRGCREELGDRPDAIQGVSRDGFAAFDIGLPKAA